MRDNTVGSIGFFKIFYDWHLKTSIYNQPGFLDIGYPFVSLWKSMYQCTLPNWYNLYSKYHKYCTYWGGYHLRTFLRKLSSPSMAVIHITQRGDSDEKVDIRVANDCPTTSASKRWGPAPPEIWRVKQKAWLKNDDEFHKWKGHSCGKQLKLFDHSAWTTKKHKWILMMDDSWCHPVERMNHHPKVATSVLNL